ncbi:MAG TPA: HTTM domain-containing protein, partial [Myxococcota bacterium]
MGDTSNDKPAAAWHSIGSLDLRALALFRVALGLVVALDAVWRLVDVEAFYADTGTRPRHHPILESLWQTPSLYAFDGSIAYASVLLIATALVGLVFAVGYRTRIAAVAQWVLVISVQNRNPQVESGADSVLGMLCLLACFLPLAARFSLDARRTDTPRAQSVSTWATFAFVLQLVVI